MFSWLSWLSWLLHLLAPSISADDSMHSMLMPKSRFMYKIWITLLVRLACNAYSKRQQQPRQFLHALTRMMIHVVYCIACSTVLDQDQTSESPSALDIVPRSARDICLIVGSLVWLASLAVQYHCAPESIQPPHPPTPKSQLVFLLTDTRACLSTYVTWLGVWTMMLIVHATNHAAIWDPIMIWTIVFVLGLSTITSKFGQQWYKQLDMKPQFEMVAKQVLVLYLASLY